MVIPYNTFFPDNATLKIGDEAVLAAYCLFCSLKLMRSGVTSDCLMYNLFIAESAEVMSCLYLKCTDELRARRRDLQVQTSVKSGHASSLFPVLWDHSDSS